MFFLKGLWYWICEREQDGNAQYSEEVIIK